jgi:hypothetical protein
VPRPVPLSNPLLLLLFRSEIKCLFSSGTARWARPLAAALKLFIINNQSTALLHAHVLVDDMRNRKCGLQKERVLRMTLPHTIE